MTVKKAGAPAQVLIVEQESAVALELQENLKKLGYKVVGIAPSGSEAIAKIENAQPDLVLMDFVLMGNMDGIQTAEAIHARKDVPVIFLTGTADERLLQRARIRHPFEYLIKPFSEHELHSGMEIALYRHHLEKQLIESEERYSLATQGANDGLWDWNVQNKEIVFSPRWKSMLGYTEDQIGNSPMDWFGKIHPGDREQVEQKISQHLAGTSSYFESEYRILDASGSYRWMLCRGMARRDSSGKAYRIAGSQTDVTDRKVYNPLTGLPNRVLFMDRLEHALKLVKSEIKAFAVAVIEAGGIRAIAGSHGWIFADQVLCHMAQKIQGCLSPRDTVAHFGEKNFMLLLEEVQDGKQAALAASQLQRELAQPIQIHGKTVTVTPHIGITLRTRDYAYPDELIRDAYTALQRAKDSGNGQIEIYDKKVRSSAVARLKLEADLRRALERREFRLHYHPIVNLGTGKVAGFEALVRWQRHEGLMFPKDFISVVESMDMMIPLERWILLDSCTQMAQWENSYRGSFTLNINLCPRHFADTNLVKELQEALRRSGLAPDRLRLEITESALMENPDAVARTLEQIRAMSIQLHMDNFGTGYSSLNHLNRFPIDSLKIDRSFVGNLGLNNETLKLVQAIAALAKNLHMDLIAEGIENITQLRMLQTLKCQYGQGYYFTKPLEPEAMEKIVSGQLPWIVAFEKDEAARP